MQIPPPGLPTLKPMFRERDWLQVKISRKTSCLSHLIVSAVKRDAVYFCGYVKLMPFVPENYTKGKELDLGAEPTRIKLCSVPAWGNVTE